MDLKKLAEKIKVARDNQGLSQESLAAVSNVSLRTIQRIEKANVTPRSATLKILSDHLNLNFEDLISEDSVVDFYAETKVLKLMNASILIVTLIPILNIILPLSIWKLSKKIDSLKHIAGMIISFQIIWLIASFCLFMMSVFLTNLITAEAGEASYVASIIYLLCVIFNFSMVIWHTFKLGNDKSRESRFAPNFF